MMLYYHVLGVWDVVKDIGEGDGVGEEMMAETFVINWFGFLYQVFYP